MWSESLVPKKSPALADVTSNTLRPATYCYILHTPLSCPCLTQKTEESQSSVPHVPDRQNIREEMCCIPAIWEGCSLSPGMLNSLPCPAYSILNLIIWCWQGMHNMKLFIMQFYYTSRYFLPLRTKYYS